jgi:hypothetical protein
VSRVRPATGRNRRHCDAGCSKEHGRQRARELADDARETLDLTTYGYATTARHAGTCPLCSKLIAAGRSQIIALAVPTFPIVAELDRDGEPKRRRRRKWCHESCVDRLEANARASHE